MLPRLIAQIVATAVSAGVRTIAREMPNLIAAWRQAQAAAATGARTQGGKQTSSQVNAQQAVSGITLNEACQILNIEPTQLKDIKLVEEKFTHLFAINDPEKGGTKYLRAKVCNAKERIDAELKSRQDADSHRKERTQNTAKEE